jgi:hypothetical protein
MNKRRLLSPITAVALENLGDGEKAWMNSIGGRWSQREKRRQRENRYPRLYKS